MPLSTKALAVAEACDTAVTVLGAMPPTVALWRNHEGVYRVSKVRYLHTLR